MFKSLCKVYKQKILILHYLNGYITHVRMLKSNITDQKIPNIHWHIRSRHPYATMRSRDDTTEAISKD